MKQREVILCVFIVLVMNVTTVTNIFSSIVEENEYRLLVYKNTDEIYPGDNFPMFARLYEGTSTVTKNITMVLTTVLARRSETTMTSMENEPETFCANITVPENITISSFAVFVNAFHEENPRKSISEGHDLIELQLTHETPVHVLTSNLVSWGESVEIESFIPRVTEEDNVSITTNFFFLPYRPVMEYYPRFIESLFMPWGYPKEANKTGEGIYKTIWTLPETNPKSVHRPAITAFVHCKINNEEFIDILEINVGNFYISMEGFVKGNDLELWIRALDKNYRDLVNPDFTIQVINENNSIGINTFKISFNSTTGVYYLKTQLPITVLESEYIHLCAQIKCNTLNSTKYLYLPNGDFHVRENVDFYSKYYTYLSKGISYSLKAYYQKEPLRNKGITVYIKGPKSFLQVDNVTTDEEGNFVMECDWPETVKNRDAYIVQFAYYTGYQWVNYYKPYRTDYTPSITLTYNTENLTTQFEDVGNQTLLSVSYDVAEDASFAYLNLFPITQVRPVYSASSDDIVGGGLQEGSVRKTIVVDGSNVGSIGVHVRVYNPKVQNFVTDYYWVISPTKDSDASQKKSTPYGGNSFELFVFLCFYVFSIVYLRKRRH